MELDDAEHGFDVVLLERPGDVRATSVAVALERPHDAGDFRRLLVSVAGHDGRDGSGQSAACVGIVRQTVAHDERAEIGVAEAQRAKDVRVLRNPLGRIARVVHDDFLRGDVNAHRGLETFDIERAVVALELHQVQRGQIAGGVVEEHVFAARVGGMNRLGAFAGVPFLNRAVVLHTGIAANPRPFGHFVEQPAGVLLLQRLAGGHGARPPVLALDRGLHELVADAHGEVFVLIHHAAVGVAVVGTIVPLLHECPRLLLFLLLAVDELLDVAVPVAQRVHLRRAPRFPA